MVILPGLTPMDLTRGFRAPPWPTQPARPSSLGADAFSRSPRRAPSIPAAIAMSSSSSVSHHHLWEPVGEGRVVEGGGGPGELELPGTPLPFPVRPHAACDLPPTPLPHQAVGSASDNAFCVLRTIECNRAYHPRRPPVPPHRHRAQGPAEPSPRARGPFACRSSCTSLVPRGLRDLSLCDQGTWLPIPFGPAPVGSLALHRPLPPSSRLLGVPATPLPCVLSPLAAPHSPCAVPRANPLCAILRGYG